MTKKRAAKPPPSDLDDRAEVGGEGVDQDFESVGMFRGPDGGMMLLPISPVAVTKLTRDGAARVTALQEAVMARRQLLKEIDRLVDELRELGVSWNVIGWSVGTTSEAARQRWS